MTEEWWIEYHTIIDVLYDSVNLYKNTGYITTVTIIDLNSLTDKDNYIIIYV